MSEEERSEEERAEEEGPREADEAPSPSAVRRAYDAIRALPIAPHDALAVLNGAFGDLLAEERSSLALPMILRSERDALELGSSAEARPLEEQLRAQGVAPSADLVVLVHGLMASETCWCFGDRSTGSFGARLAEEHGATPLYLRYNSGRHISENGRALASLLTELHAAWPLPIRSLSLIGHSMGGLVSRSACHYAQEEGAPWLGSLSRLFILGSPHRGAALEQLAHALTVTLRVIPSFWSQAIGRAINRRSAGIKDLRHGYLIDEEWAGKDPDAPSLGRSHLVPLPKGVHCYVLAGTLAEEERSAWSKILGDSLVAPWSAKDEGFFGDPVMRAGHRARVFSKMSHMGLAHEDAVYEQIREWWDLLEETSVSEEKAELNSSG